MTQLSRYVPRDIQELYEVHNFRNAAQVLATGCASEFKEFLEGLRQFRLTIADIRKPGGNESDIPKLISALLRGKGWMETRITGDLLITKVSEPPTNKRKGPGTEPEGDAQEESELETTERIESLKAKGARELKKAGGNIETITRKSFLDGHKVDYVKNRVAFDLEWNSKDQTFDRDLYAFRAFHDCDLIDAAVLVTRGTSLNPVFEMLGAEIDETGKPRMTKIGKPKLVKSKYGASTTWMGKLLPRLNAGRHGGCPILALGIKPALISDWSTYEKELTKSGS